MSQERERLQQLIDLSERLPMGGLLDPRRTVVAMVLQLVEGLLSRIEELEKGRELQLDVIDAQMARIEAIEARERLRGELHGGAV